MRHLDLFSGIGGFTLAAEQVGGIKTTQFVEIDPDAQAVLRSHWRDIPIHEDIRTYQCSRGNFDLTTVGFPCTGTSIAGTRTGLDHEHSGLWFEALRVINECRPRFIIIENPTGLLSHRLLNRGMDRVLWGLSESGYDAEWQTISAAALKAPHRRERVFIIAYPECLEIHGQKPTCWADQVRDMVQEQRAISRFPMFESTDDGAVVRFPDGLDEVPVGVERGSPGRIRSRYLFGRTVVPACAAIALRRVKYLNSCIERS
ncbi:DNA-methyltransferase Dcm [Synechococcus sp. PCC 7502]|uniref:DNA cytosine methyltransferase n=1 Tax=Synechococcus sp. PCC 7502 TaxID=1173263 RepID=UPI00029FB695|nr:DNA cytosine methyltransferase [Synechococcus sp. PCC 7502]AFY74752.1 DNA-methyltransferase Dcm [Synechococcus sp. PCC 7502]